MELVGDVVGCVAGILGLLYLLWDFGRHLLCSFFKNEFILLCQ